MKYFQVLEVKEFMNMLLTKEVFDDFLLVNASVIGKGTLILEGRTSDGEDVKYLPYGGFRNVLFEFIKGKILPKNIKLVLQLSVEDLKVALGDSVGSEDTASLTINFKEDGLFIASGFATGAFNLDRTNEINWDKYATEYLNDLGLTIDVL